MAILQCNKATFYSGEYWQDREERDVCNFYAVIFNNGLIATYAPYLGNWLWESPEKIDLIDSRHDVHYLLDLEPCEFSLNRLKQIALYQLREAESLSHGVKSKLKELGVEITQEQEFEAANQPIN